MHFKTTSLVVFALALVGPAVAREDSSLSPHSVHYSSSTLTEVHHRSSSHSRVPQGVRRDANGRIHRSASAKRAFQRETGYPHGRPGYVVDHIVPLKRGGADEPSNMQWQTIEAAKQKDRWE